MESRHVDLEGPVHYLDFGGDGPPLVCLHGLGGSALNWMAVGPALAVQHRALALDLRGFGHTPLGTGTRLQDNQRLLDLFLREVAGPPATLVANSMGGLLAVRQAVNHPDTVHNLVLVNPALPWRRGRLFDVRIYAFFAVLLTPGLGERALFERIRSVGAERAVEAAFNIVCANPDRVPAHVVGAHVELERNRMRWLRSQRALAQAARSLLWALTTGGGAKTYGRVRTPVLLLQGKRDRLVPVRNSLEIGQRFGWLVEVLPEVGHVPMMEAPDEFARVTLSWLGTQPAAA